MKLTKTFKSIISLICAVALIMSLGVTSLTAEAAPDTYSAAVSAIINGLKDGVSSIDVSKYNVAVDDFSELYSDLLHEYPELFHVKTSYSYAVNPVTDCVVFVNPMYIFTQQQYKAKKVEFDNAAADYLRYITDDMTDFTKALILHDLLVQRNVYSADYYESLKDSSHEIPYNCYTAYGALVDRSAVCQGYSMAYHYLLGLCGVESGYASSDAMNHIWNMVKIGGSYYHVDVTWDDARYYFGSTAEDLAGMVQHTYFLRTDEEIKVDEKGNQDHHDWVSDYKATSTAYSNSFVRNIATTGVSYYGGYYYYIDSTGALVKMKQRTSTKQTVYKIETGKWNESETSYRLWKAANSRAYLVGNYLYFTECKKVMVLNLARDSVAPFVAGTPTLANDECLYGLEIIDNVGYCDVLNAASSMKCRQKFELSVPNYDFIVSIIDSEGNDLGNSATGRVGESFKLFTHLAPGASDSYNITVSDESIVKNDEKSSSIVLLAKGYATVTVTSVSDPSCTQTVSFTVEQGKAKTPSAPSVLTKTENSVTLKPVDGCEYSMDKVNWQTSNVFEGLETDKDYSFYIRVAETEDVLASDPSAALTVHLSSSNETIHGDCNFDGKVNLMDLVALRKHLAKWSISINLDAADCNADGKVNLMDLVLLRKYLAKWNVTLGPKE